MEYKNICNDCSEQCKLHDFEDEYNCPKHYGVLKSTLIPLIKDKLAFSAISKNIELKEENYNVLIKQGIENYIDTHIPYNNDGTKVVMTLDEVIDEMIFEEIDSVSLKENE